MTSQIVVETPLRVGRTISASWWGFIGPLILLLNATAVPVLDALRLAFVLVLLSLGGLVVVHMTGLNRMKSSVIGQLLLGLSLALGVVALFAQFLGLVARHESNWLVVLIFMQLPLAYGPTRQQIRQRFIEQPVLADHELPALWFLIFGVLTTSSHIFAVGVVLVIASFLALQLKRGEFSRFAWLQYVPIWISVIGIYLASIWLGWKQQSPWAFSLRSLDNAQWVAMAWSVDAYGWTSDPTAAGFSMSYHFLAQAQAGLLSRLADISIVATTSFAVPIIAVAGSYVALKAFFGRYLGSASATLLPPMVLLSCLGPLEPNSPLSTEHFTYLVAIPYFCIAVVLMTTRTFKSYRWHILSLAAIATLTSTTKINAAVLLPSVALGLAVSALAHNQFRVASRLLYETVVLTATVLISAWFFYLRLGPPSSRRVVLGFGSIEYRFGMIGGPYLGSLVSSLLLVLYSLPVLLCLAVLLVRRSNFGGGNTNNFVIHGLAICGICLFLGAFFLQMPPVGKPEIYLSSTGLMLAVLVLVLHTWSDYWKDESESCLGRRLFFTSILTTATFSIASSAWIWSERFWNWQSSRRFLVAYTIPYLVIAVCTAALSLQRNLNTKSTPLTSLSTLRFALSSFVVLCVTASVSTNVAYGARGPLSALVDVVDSRASLNEFEEELYDSWNLNTNYQSILETVQVGTPGSAVIVSNADLVGSLLIASEAQRRMWWIEFTALSNPGVEGAAVAHLTWRKSQVDAFLADPSRPQIRSMLRCGVTHAVIDRTRTALPPERFVLLGLTSLTYSNETHFVLEFNGSSTDSDIPDVSWLKWCGV